MEELYEKIELIDTSSLQRFLGVRVITPSGLVVGRVKEVRSDKRAIGVAGIVVSRSFFKKPLYIGREYLDLFSSESIVLKIEPTLLLKGMRVISGEGEFLGYVAEVVRVRKTNALDYLKVKQAFRKLFIIKSSQIESYGKALLLKGGVDVPQRSFWS